MKVFISRYPKDSSKERKVEVRIDKYDTWNANTTLATIIAPLIEKFMQDMQSIAIVDDTDVPEAIKSTSANVVFQGGDEFSKNRWIYVLSEIHWTMNEIANETEGESKFYEHPESTEGMSIEEQVRLIKIDEEGLKTYHARLQKGCELFGKYFQNLWD